MTPVLVEMIPSHLDRVIKIERAVYPSPWKRRDFEFARNRKNGFLPGGYGRVRDCGLCRGFFD